MDVGSDLQIYFYQMMKKNFHLYVNCGSLQKKIPLDHYLDNY